MPRSLLSLCLLGVAGVAFAGGWSSWDKAFPSNPCQDGWAACLTDSGAVGAGTVKDSAGRPMPADMRVGWFDLKPTAEFSPFVGLSAYSGPIGAQQAAATPPPPPPAPSRPTEADVATPPPPSHDAPPQQVASYTPPPSTSPSSMPPSTSSGGSGMRPNAPSTPPTTTTASTPTTTTSGGMNPNGSSSMAPNTKGATATTAAAPPTTTTTTMPTASPQSASPPPQPQTAAMAPVTAAGDDSCDDLVKLEPAAMMGTLRPGQAKCLDARVGSEAQQTMKDKVSRLLIANAEAKGDKGEWERLVKRHLEDIDRSDPDMCFKYALQLSRGGSARASGVIRWADYALENKAKWTGNTYKTRVFNLYKLRAEAAQKLWQDAEAAYMTGDHTDENEAKAAKLRGTAKDYAREWLDYAKASEQDTKTAMALCVSAAGNRAFCEGG